MKKKTSPAVMALSAVSLSGCWTDSGLTGLGGSLWLRLLWMLPISVCELDRETPSKYGLKKEVRI